MVITSAQREDEQILRTICRERPAARANIAGSDDFPDIRGRVDFYRVGRGVVVVAEINGLPSGRGDCREEIFAMHIHEGKSCTGTRRDPFADTGGHFNPDDCQHPNHEGDLPPLFGNNGFAWTAVFTNRFRINDIIDRTVVIHRRRDDFTTQPAGASGAKIACGEIKRR